MSTLRLRFYTTSLFQQFRLTHLLLIWKFSIDHSRHPLRLVKVFVLLRSVLAGETNPWLPIPLWHTFFSSNSPVAYYADSSHIRRRRSVSYNLSSTQLLSTNARLPVCGSWWLHMEQCLRWLSIWRAYLALPVLFSWSSLCLDTSLLHWGLSFNIRCRIVEVFESCCAVTNFPSWLALRRFPLVLYLWNCPISYKRAICLHFGGQRNEKS